MIPLGLSSGERKAFHAAFADSHTVTLEIDVLDLEHHVIDTLDPVVLDGQVNVDAGGEVTRSATVTFLDPSRTLSFDSDSPARGAMYADRMLRIRWSILGPGLSERVTVPVFTGPLVKFDRNGDEVSVECQGKELLAMSPVWRPLTLRKGMKKTEAIETIMRNRYGETRFAIPDLKTRLPRTISLNRLEVGWKAAQKIARSMNRQLYYDGRGTLRLRTYSRQPVFTFKADRSDATVTEPVQVSHEIASIKNAIWVKGATPKGRKRPVAAIAVAPQNHPLSPDRLGRKGHGRYLPEEISDDSIRSEKEARRVARRILDDRLTSVMGITFSAVPIPHLEPMDMCRIVTDEFSANFRLRQFSFPLTTSGVMTVGYNERVSRARRHIR